MQSKSEVSPSCYIVQQDTATPVPAGGAFVKFAARQWSVRSHTASIWLAWQVVQLCWLTWQVVQLCWQTWQIVQFYWQTSCNSMACAPMLRRGAMAVVEANEAREKESHAGECSCLVEEL